MNNVATLLCAVLTDTGTLLNPLLSGNYNLQFTEMLVQSKNIKGCQDIQLNWNTLIEVNNIHYTIKVFTEDQQVVWNSTTDEDHMIISHQYLKAGVKYEVELEVIVAISEDTLGDVPSQLLNITAPACSKPNGEQCLVWKHFK